MKPNFVFAVVSGLFFGVDAAPVCLLTAPGSAPMAEGMDRLGIEFEEIKTLPSGISEKTRLIILCGSEPPVSEDAIASLRTFMERGDSLLVVGGASKWAIDNGLIDASGYYPNGSTIHQTSFEGIHPIFDGYPGEKPKQSWDKGVPMLFRLTGGPLMETGLKAVSLLSYGPPFSAVAMQSYGHGLLFAVGPDPQGGDVFYTLDEATKTTGEEQGTDRFLKNVISFLVERRVNLLPNPEFEETLKRATEYASWNLQGRRGGEGNHEKKGVVVMKCTAEDSVVNLNPSGSILVEPEKRYECRVRFRGDAPKWSLRGATKPQPKGAEGVQEFPTVYIPSTEGWSEHIEIIDVPSNHSYLSLSITLSDMGSLEIESVFLGLSDQRPTFRPGNPTP